ncbi:hypothetical protein SCP_0204250 [Sparassis crispa]|uniref:Protein kinase domain-containing protein n=1 Tax=Sparassis crispa TaxID=139825 RepID=A0A401GAN5_9APHY|nr:hypothetical protein SCP_0204250 [Sparassis crispa]GBE79228.1 hypothetical protein SCP_0204250 [Sparassis crispa]
MSSEEPTVDEIFGVLRPWEARWRDRQQFLEAHGYMLRPRYHPGWTPSWGGTGKHPLFYEDAITLPPREHLIDATRIADGRLVYIKRVKTGDNESEIATMLSAESLLHDPMNHCVRVLEIFQDTEDQSISYMVMPFLVLIDSIPFEIVENIVDFTDQILEGLVFIHNKGVAHRDCTYKNLMMDVNALYPQGFHPVNDLFFPDGLTPLPYHSRTDAPITYYYIDFGISVVIPPDVHPKLALGDNGRDQEVPELSLTIPYDPFKVDSFIIGNVLRHEFRDKFSNVDFLIPLIESMTRTDPHERPDAARALTEWQNIRCKLGYMQRRWRLRPRGETWLWKVISDAVSFVGTTFYLCKTVFGWVIESSG